MSARNYRTEKGTELPLLNLRGKQYLEVKYRLVWFREEHPTWSIETQLVSVTDTSAYAKATIRDDTGRIIATSHKFESVQGFPDFIEKAETGAIGRALALIGYGTQFCADELDEGKRIVDAPVEMAKRAPANAPKIAVGVPDHTEVSSNEEAVRPGVTPGDFTINFGRKYKGKKLKEISRSELESYVKWLEASAVRDGTSLSFQVQQLKNAYERLYGPLESAAVAEAH
jgi:hypothetical protein